MSQEIVQSTSPDSLDWFRKGTLYQIFPDRFAQVGQASGSSLSPWGSAPSRENFFGGNLAGISTRLPYLERIGIANIYLNPIFSSPSNHRYDTQNYFHIDPLLGDENHLANLIGSAENSGVGILLDGVFNHVGDRFHSFVRALTGEAAERELFNFVGDSSIYQTCGGADFLPKLNHENPQVLKMITEVMSYWNSFGIKGWRLDVPWKVPPEFWQQLRISTQSLGSTDMWIAEAWQQWAFADDFQSVTNYFARNRLVDFVSRHDADAEDLAIDIEQWCRLRQDPSLISNFVGSHDTARLVNECGGSRRDALMVLIMNQFLPGVPVLYYGDEIGLTGGNDPDCRGTFPLVFSKEQKQFLAALEPILGLRKIHQSLSHGDFSVIESRNRTLIVKRRFEDCAFTVVVNAGDRDQLVSTALPMNMQSIVGEQVSGNTVPSHSLLISGGTECACLKR
jgi:cyclomaltodextrinase